MKRTLQCPKCESRKMFSCAHCGYSELYADTTDLVPNPELGVRLLDNEPAGDLR